MTEDDEFDPESDLLDRYESMVETQVQTLEGIDEKTARIMRIIPLILSGLLTAFSIVLNNDGIGPSESGPVPLFTIAIGFGVLLVSFGYTIITYLSSVFQFGPTVRLGEFMAEYRVDSQEYKDKLLGGYSSAIRENRRVVNANSRRFRRALVSFLCSMVLLAAGFAGTLVQFGFRANVVLLLLLTLGLLAVIEYIEREEYLTLERQREDDE